MSSYVNSICRSASLALRNIGGVRKYIIIVVIIIIIAECTTVC